MASLFAALGNDADARARAQRTVFSADAFCAACPAATGLLHSRLGLIDKLRVLDEDGEIFQPQFRCVSADSSDDENENDGDDDDKKKKKQPSKLKRYREIVVSKATPPGSARAQREVLQVLHYAALARDNATAWNSDNEEEDVSDDLILAHENLLASYMTIELLKRRDATAQVVVELVKNPISSTSPVAACGVIAATHTDPSQDSASMVRTEIDDAVRSFTGLPTVHEWTVQLTAAATRPFAHPPSQEAVHALVARTCTGAAAALHVPLLHGFIAPLLKLQQEQCTASLGSDPTSVLLPRLELIRWRLMRAAVDDRLTAALQAEAANCVKRVKRFFGADSALFLLLTTTRCISPPPKIADVPTSVSSLFSTTSLGYHVSLLREVAADGQKKESSPGVVVMLYVWDLALHELERMKGG